jgi:hypothetical protein
MSKQEMPKIGGCGFVADSCVAEGYVAVGAAFGGTVAAVGGAGGN